MCISQSYFLVGCDVFLHNPMHGFLFWMAMGFAPPPCPNRHPKGLASLFRHRPLNSKDFTKEEASGGRRETRADARCCTASSTLPPPPPPPSASYRPPTLHASNALDDPTRQAGHRSSSPRMYGGEFRQLRRHNPSILCNTPPNPAGRAFRKLLPLLPPVLNNVLTRNCF